jgi:hypothetical protein
MQETLEVGSDFAVEDFGAFLFGAASEAIRVTSAVSEVIAEFCSEAATLISDHFREAFVERKKACTLPWHEAQTIARRAGLSKFEARAGWLMAGYDLVPGARYPDRFYLHVAADLDAQRLRPVEHIEGQVRRKLATNNRDARKAIHTFKAALDSEQYRTGARRTLYRARDRFLRAVIKSQ